jgi:hypothetical protein
MTTKRVDWSGIKQCLALLHAASPIFLTRSLLIGGAASWFYRIQLQNARDPDFREPPETERTREIWLSKDIDFTGIFRGDAYELLPAFLEKADGGRTILQVNGVRVGFAQVGVTFDPEEAFARARIAEFQEGGHAVQFLVMDPVSLYREKQALAQKRNQPNDALHLSVLKEFLAWEFVNACQSFVSEEQASVSSRRSLTLALLDFKQRAVEIASDPRVIKRVQDFLLQKNERTTLLREVFFSNG